MPRNFEAMPSSPPPVPEDAKPKKERHLRSVSLEEAEAAKKKKDAEADEEKARYDTMYKEIAPDMTEQAHEVDPKDEARWKKAHEALAPDMTEEVHEVDPRDEARYKEARAALDAAPDFRDLAPPPAPPPFTKPQKKSAWQKFKGIFGR